MTGKTCVRVGGGGGGCKKFIKKKTPRRLHIEPLDAYDKISCLTAWVTSLTLVMGKTPYRLFFLAIFREDM